MAMPRHARFQHGTDRADQLVAREWLLQQINSRLQDLVMDNCVIGIAGHVNHFHRGACTSDLLY